MELNKKENYYIYTNFPKDDLPFIEKAIKSTNINDYIIEDNAVDIFGKPLKNNKVLYLHKKYNPKNVETDIIVNKYLYYKKIKEQSN